MNKILVQADGKIIVGGDENGDFALARYLPNGTPDPSFGNGGMTTSDFGGIEAIYNIGIRSGRLYTYDGNSSDILAAYRLNSWTPPTFLNDKTIVLDAGCAGNDGNISIIPTSGTAPYMYSIDGGANYVSGPGNGYTFQNLSAGTYQLRLKDANGCESAVIAKEVKTVYWSPTFLNNAQIVLDASCNGNDGAISIIPTCGVSPFQYSIDGGATYVAGPDRGYTFQGLAASTYQLRLKDGNGNQSAVVTRQVKPSAFGSCATLSAINQRLRSSAIEATSVRAYPNPSRGQFRIQLTGFASTRVQVSVLDARGSIVQTRTVNANEGNSFDVNLTGKAKGLYFVRVVSDKGIRVQKVQVQ